MKQENTFGPYLEPGKLFIYGDFQELWADFEATELIETDS